MLLLQLRGGLSHFIIAFSPFNPSEHQRELSVDQTLWLNLGIDRIGILKAERSVKEVLSFNAHVSESFRQAVTDRGIEDAELIVTTYKHSGNKWILLLETAPLIYISPFQHGAQSRGMVKIDSQRYTMGLNFF